MTDVSGVTPEMRDELKRRREERDRANAALNDQRNQALETEAPDDAAYDLAKGQELGVPREAVAADRDRYKQEDTLARFEKMRKEAPKVSAWLAAPENYAVARDDVETLVSSEKQLDPWLTEEGGRLMDMSKTFNAFFGNIGSSVRAAIPGWKAQGAGLAQQQFESLGAYNAELDAFEKSRDGMITIGVGDVSVSLNPAWFGVGDPRPEAPLLAKMLNLEDPSGLVLRQPGPDKFREEARKRYDAVLKPLAAESARIGKEASAEQKALMPQTGDFVADSLLSGVTSFVNMAPSIAGFMLGGPTTGATIMAGQVRGQTYGEGRNEYGLEPTAANERSVGHTLIELVSERVSLGILDDILQSSAPLWKKMLTGMAAEQVQEQAATLGGDAIDWATINQEKTLGEFIAERPAAAAQTALATLVASGGMQGTVLAIDYGTRAFMRDAVAAQPTKGDKLIDGLLNDASKSKLRTRTPEKAAELAGRLTEGTGAETVVVDLDGLAQSLEAAGLNIMDAMTEMGIPPDAINETAIIMGQVEVPTARLMVSEGIQTHRDKVQPHLRLKGEDLTPAQKEAIGAEATSQAQKFSEAIREDVARDADFAGQMAEVEDQVTEELRTAGFSGQNSVLRANAVLASRMAAYVAKRRGQDVRDVWAEIGPKIMGSFGEAGTTDVLRQAEEAGYTGSDRGEAESWLAAVEKGLPMETEARMARATEQGYDTGTVVYRGDAADVTAFDGVVFTTTDPEVADAYAFRKGRRKLRDEGPNEEESATLERLDAERADAERQMRGLFVGKDRKSELRRERDSAMIEESRAQREFSTLRGGQVMPMYGRMTNPLVIEDGSTLDPSGDVPTQDIMRDLIERARSEGRDGVIIKNWFDSWGDKPTEIRVFLDPANIRSVHAAFDPDQSASADLLAQSIRKAATMDMQLVNQWVAGKVDTNIQDFTNGDESAVMKWDLTDDPDSPPVMMSIRLSAKTGRADVNLFLNNQMADSLESVEDINERSRLAMEMFAQAVMVMRQYAAETPDLKTFAFIAAESEAEGTNRKSREALYRFMLSKLPMQGYTAYEVQGQTSLVSEQDGTKVAAPWIPGPGQSATSGFFLVRDGESIEDFARTEILRGRPSADGAGEIVSAQNVIRLTPEPGAARGGMGRGGSGVREAGAGGAFTGDELDQLIGPKAKGANKAILNRAKEMAKERVKTGKGLFAKSKPKYTRQQIWDETAKLGQPWYQDKNGDWISEIEDGSIVVKDGKGRMSEVIEMPSIYAQYPELRKQSADGRDPKRVRRETGRPEPDGVGGWYQKTAFLFDVNIRIMSRGERGEYTATHEIQHAVDYIENREMGLKKSYDNRDTERRAFNTMYRRLWTMEERIATPPWETEQEAIDWWRGGRKNDAPAAEFVKDGTFDPVPGVNDPEIAIERLERPEGSIENAQIEGGSVPGEIEAYEVFDEARQRVVFRFREADRASEIAKLMGRTFLNVRSIAVAMRNNPRLRQMLLGEGPVELTDEERPAFKAALNSELSAVAKLAKELRVKIEEDVDWKVYFGVRGRVDEGQVFGMLRTMDLPILTAAFGHREIANAISKVSRTGVSQYETATVVRTELVASAVWDALSIDSFSTSQKTQDAIIAFRGMNAVEPQKAAKNPARIPQAEIKAAERAVDGKLLDLDAPMSEQKPEHYAAIRAAWDAETDRLGYYTDENGERQPEYVDYWESDFWLGRPVYEDDGSLVGKRTMVPTPPLDQRSAREVLELLAERSSNEDGGKWMEGLLPQLRAAGIVGAKYVPGGINTAADAPPQTQSIVIFDERAPVLLTDQSGNLMQERRGGYSSSTRQIVFTEARDVSTFMHETAHWFLDTLEKLAPTEAWAAADLAEIDAWYQTIRGGEQMARIRARYGVTATADGWQVSYRGQLMERPFATEAEAMARIEWRERQEAFAETFEQYLQTGKAPVPKLVEVFRAFRDWLVQLYKGMMPRERESLNPAIREVFDRVLAVDTEVDAASAEAFRDADTMAKEMLAKGVITERQYRMVGERLNKAREEVKEEMIARALQEEMRTREAWWAKEKARVKGDLARAFDKSEVGRAFNWLAYGEWKGDVGVEQPVEEEAYGALFQSAARLQDRPLTINGTGPGGRVLNRDLAKAFTERHMKKYGRALDPADPADYKTILKSMLEDFREQSAQQDTGDAWYTDDINEAISLTAQIYPELETSPTFRDLFLTVTALLSPQQKPAQNWENAILAMRSWRETGRIEVLKPSGKQYGVLSHSNGLKMLQHLIDTMGLEAALQWVQTEHTGREIAEMRMASGLFAPIDTATGKVSTKVKDYQASETNLTESKLGIYAFGPKVGDFMQNSVGIDQNAVTVDLWLARTYNRYIGRLTDVSPAQAEQGAIASEIRGRAEREHIKNLVRDAAKKAGMDPSAMQAALWYFEQRLYRAHGIKSDSQNFSGAARAALQKRDIDARSSESNKRVAGQDVREDLQAGGQAASSNGAGVRRTSGGTATFAGRDAATAAVFGEATQRPVYEVTDAGLFRDLIGEAKAALGAIGAQVTAYDDYTGKRLFLFDDGASGFALDGDDIISVFSIPGKAPKGAAQRVLDVAVSEGGRRLDAFGTFLPGLYARSGFRAVARLGFSREYAPPGWDYDFFAEAFPETAGEPDVVFMVYDPANAGAVTDNIVADYDSGLAAQAQAVRAPEMAQDFLAQTRTFNPPGHGPVAPPPNIPPVRLDLKIVRDLYGEEALRKLPAAVRRRSSTSSNVTDILATIETVRKTLSKKRKGPQTLTQFIMAKKRANQDGTKEDIPWGIKGAADELKAMGLGKLINEKSGRTLDYMREAAEEAGFIRPRAVDADLNREASDLDTTQNDLLEALAREAKGEAVVRIGEEGDTKEVEDARVWVTWLEQNGVDIYETDKKKLRASVEAMLSATEESLVSPDQAAELFGFTNGEELLAALAEVGNRDKFLDAQADRALANEFGDMMKDGTLIEEAREAARLSILGRQSEIELEALSRAVGQQASAKYARQMARDIIAMRTVKEIAAYERDLDNERRFAKQALTAVSKGDYAAALKAKQRQIIAAQMYSEGKKAHERIEKQRKDLLKYLTSESRRDKIANDYLERIDAVLDDFELRVSKQGPSVQKARQSAAAYVAWMTEQGREAEIAPEAMLLATQASLKTWRNLTAEEVDYLVGTIENLAHLGRTKQRLLNDKEKRQREAILDELEAALLAAPSAKTSREKSFTPTVGEGVATWLRKAHARLTRMEFQFVRLDGREGGPLHTALFQPFADAADRETLRMRDAAVKMQALYSAFTTAERNALFHRRISTPELKVPGAGLTLMDAVVIGLNWGNAGNRQALIDGYGWDPAAIEAMLNRVLTDKHWDFIEGVWDLIGSYRDDAFALEKSITGVAPKAVEGVTFTLANGRKIEGKYYPLKYDSGQARADSVKQARLDEKQMLNEMGKSFSKPMTKTGHLIERVGSGGKPVKLSIGVFHEHVASVIHDIAYRRAIIDVYKLVTSPRFANAYIQAAGREQYDTLVPWIAQIANERKDEPGGYVTDLLRGARRNFSIMAMGLKFGTAVQQATGVLQGVPLIGTRYAAQGFFKAMGGGLGSFWSAWNWVSLKSEFMRDRPMGFDRDVREVTNKLQERTPLGFVRRNAFILIGVMDTAVSTGVWIGAYDKAMDGNVPGMAKGDEEAAIAYADSIVRRSQVAGRMQDLPQMMRGTELEKLMTVVYSYFSGLYNETASEILRVRGGQINPLAFTANMTILYVVVPLIASALAGRLFAEDDDDELDEKIAKELASNAASTIPFARDVINATINPQFGYQLSPAGSIIEGGTKAASNLATGEGFSTEYATKQTFNLMGLLFGLPTGQLWITGEYVYGVATGEEDPAADPADAAREALLRDTR